MIFIMCVKISNMSNDFHSVLTLLVRILSVGSRSASRQWRYRGHDRYW